MIETVMSRWAVERNYEELKGELGLGDFEGRNWRGFHHHASLCIAAYGFLLLERLAGHQKKPAALATPAVPANFKPRGASTASRANLDRHHPLSPGPGDCPNAGTLSVLRPAKRCDAGLMTQ
jgi:hypothetical protein